MAQKNNISGYSLFEICKDDEHFQLKAGDIVLGCTYQYDPGKTSVAFRISDGFKPGCNQYNNNVRRLSTLEAERALWR